LRKQTVVRLSIPTIQSDRATASFFDRLKVPCPELLACLSIAIEEFILFRKLS